MRNEPQTHESDGPVARIKSAPLLGGGHVTPANASDSAASRVVRIPELQLLQGNSSQIPLPGDRLLGTGRPLRNRSPAKPDQGTRIGSEYSEANTDQLKFLWRLVSNTKRHD